MMLEAAALAAMLSFTAVEDRQGLVLPQGRLVATPRPQPLNRVHEVRRSDRSDRLWIGRAARSHAADPNAQRPLDWADPGPAAYGAAEDDFSTALIRVGHNAVGISPFERQHLARLEEGRRQWLAERGYTGSVRTHVSDRALRARAGHGQAQPTPPAGDVLTHANPSANTPAKPAAAPEPRAVFELPEDMPRQKSRLRVDATTAKPDSASNTTANTTPGTPAFTSTKPASEREPSVKQAPAAKPIALAQN